MAFDQSESCPKTTPLTLGQVAVVDSDDFQALSKHSWQAFPHKSAGFYAGRCVRVPGTKKHRMIYMHREITGAKKGFQVDHVDHDGLNNRKSNLRACVSFQNQGNRRSGPHTSKYKGVILFRRLNLWRAQIKIKGFVKSLGYYHSEKQAALAYNKAAENYFGEFALLNAVAEA